MTRADGVLLAGVLGLALVLIPATVGLAGQDTGSAVVRGPSGETEIDLSRDGHFIVEGNLGDIVLSVHDGAVRVEESPCPEHRCMRMGPVEDADDVIVCAPGGVVIIGSGAPEVDDVVR